MEHYLNGIIYLTIFYIYKWTWNIWHEINKMYVHWTICVFVQNVGDFTYSGQYGYKNNRFIYISISHSWVFHMGFHFRCTYHQYFIHVQCTYHQYFIHVQCTYHQYFIHVQCTYHQYFIHVQCTYHQYFIHVKCTYNLHIWLGISTI